MLQMRLTLCARFAILLAFLLTNTEALGMPEDSDTPAPAAAPQPALTSLLKDTKNVKSQDFLLQHDLDDIAGVRETYLQSRTEWLEFFALMQILDSLIDYAAARQGVPWASKPAVVLDVFDGVGGKIGTPRVVTGETRTTVRLRAMSVLKAFIPTGTFWKQDLITFPKDRPILAFIKDLDDMYLAVERSDFLNAQAAFFGFRWQIDMPMRPFNRQFMSLGKEYDKLNVSADDMDPEFMWEQYEIALTTVNRTNPAAGMPFFASDFETCNAKRKAGKQH